MMLHTINFLKEIRTNNIQNKSILINSRISPQSFNKWKYIRGLCTKITSTFDEIFAQSQLDKERIKTKLKSLYIEAGDLEI